MFCNGPCSNDVYWVLNRLYKPAPTACATFEWVGGAANLPWRHRPTQTHLESVFLGIFCYRHIMIELHLYMIERWGGLQCIFWNYRCIYAGEYCTTFGMDICKDQEMEFNPWYARNRKYLKTLIQGVLVLVCDVMAGWPPPNPLKGWSWCWGSFL